MYTLLNENNHADANIVCNKLLSLEVVNFSFAIEISMLVGFTIIVN